MRPLLAIFLLLCSQQLVSSYRILGLFPLNGKSHFIISQELLKGLAKRGHQVDVVSHFPLEKKIPNYNDISLKGSMPNIVNNLTFTDIDSRTSKFSVSYFVEESGTKLCNLMDLPQFQEIIKNPPKDPPYDLVIVELFVSPCFLAFGRHLNVPIVGIITSGFHDWLNYPTGNPFNSAATPSVISTFGQNMTFWQRFLNTLQVELISNQINYFTGAQNSHVKKYFGSDYPDVVDFYKDVALFLTNSHYSLSGVRPLNPSIVQIGGLHISRKDDVPLSPKLEKFINETDDGFVYFTFGSMARFETFPLQTIKAFYGAFRSIAPVKVLIKAAKPEQLPPGLPKNVLVQTWFPQVALLNHKKARAFITHGGLMGTMESIAYGVPMIGIPLFADQYINLKNYVSKGVAISFESYLDITEKKLTDALTTILNDPSYKKNMKTLSDLFMDRPLSPMDTATYWVEYVAKYGNVLQNPIVNLYWWQRNLLDVYAAMIAIIGIVVIIILSAFIAIRRKFFKKQCPSKPSQKELLNKKKQK